MEPSQAKVRKSELFAQNHFLSRTYFLDQNAPFRKNDFWAESAILSIECSLELSRSSIPLSPIRLWARTDPDKWIFAPKITFSLQNQLYITFTIS